MSQLAERQATPNSGTVMHRTPPANPKTGHLLPRLGDFTTDRRVLMLIAMAIVVGTGAAAAAWLLLRAIALVTNWYGSRLWARKPYRSPILNPACGWSWRLRLAASASG
jgi:hypothetical protein